MIANINFQTIKGWNRAIIDRWPAVIFSAEYREKQDGEESENNQWE